MSFCVLRQKHKKPSRLRVSFSRCYTLSSSCQSSIGNRQSEISLCTPNRVRQLLQFGGGPASKRKWPERERFTGSCRLPVKFKSGGLSVTPVAACVKSFEFALEQLAKFSILSKKTDLFWWDVAGTAHNAKETIINEKRTMHFIILSLRKVAAQNSNPGCRVRQ
jgi:hypothetical protein